jgi:hypothetical protein
MSSGFGFANVPGDLFAVGVAVLEAAVEDPNQAIAERAQRLAVGLASGTLEVVVAAGPG